MSVEQRSLCPVRLFAHSARTQCHGPGRLKPQKFIVSLFWSPRVQDQGISREGSLRGYEENLFSASHLASSGLLAIFGGS